MPSTHPLPPACPLRASLSSYPTMRLVTAGPTDKCVCPPTTKFISSNPTFNVTVLGHGALGR